jgi:ligand-binding sensor domain-containing protein
MLLVKRCFLLLLLSSITAAQLSAQVLPGVKYFSLSEGGRPVKIKTIFKTKQGFIYAGTAEGLYRFDGTAFYKIPFKDSVINAAVTAIFEDEDHLLWVGYANGNIAKKINNRLVVYSPEEGTPQKAITAFINDRQHNLWFATNGEGIYYSSGNHLYLIDTDDGLSDLNIHALAITSTGEMLAASDQGINICSVSGSNKKIRALTSANGLPDNLVTCIVPASSGQFWVGLQDKGYCLYDHRTQKFTTPAAAWPGGQVNALLVTEKNLWIATEQNGLLNSNDPLTGSATNSGHSFSNPLDGLLQDNEGNFWLASGNQLVRTNGEKLRFLPLYNEQSFKTVHAILADKKDDIWMGIDKSLVRFSRSDNYAVPKKFLINGLGGSVDITALYQDKYNNVWIGTMGKGVFVMDPQTGKYRSITENTSLAAGSILSVSGRDNTVCVSSLEGIAVFELSQANATINSNYDYRYYSNISGVGSSYVYSIYKDSKNRLWFATDGKGITVLDNGSYTNYDEKAGLKSDVVYSVTEDAKGNIWFSTRDAGIYKFDGKSFTNYSTVNGLSDLNISDVKTDALGNIVIVNKQGLDILDPATNKISFLNTNQGIGLVNTEDLGCVTLDTKGNILFSTDHGLAMYSPVKNSISQSQTSIENIQLFLDDLGADPPKTFSSSQNSFTIAFNGLYYTAPEQVVYQYKLEGYNSEWVSTRDRKVSFAKLPPAKYKFRVRSSLSMNFEGSSEASYEFVIEKPLWQRWWFILFCVVGTSLAVWWYVRRRERHLKHLQKLEQEKVQFQFQVLRNQVNPHFLFNSFNTLISTIEDDPKMAVEYVEHLSEFFRNIVNYRDKDVISLKEELGLLENYIFLQQKRYGSNLQLTIDVPEDLQSEIFIPPLTLQLLTENAIKHNAVSRETPLLVSVFTNAEFLVVKNNINPRRSKQAGAGMGLQNIISRYNLLGSKKVIVNNTGEFFIVSLPILKQVYG